MLSRSIAVCILVALVNLSTSRPAHAGSAAAAYQPIATFKHFGGGSTGPYLFDQVRFEIGFATPYVTPPAELNQPIFSNTQLTTDDDGLRFFANAENTSGFAGFVNAFHQQDQGFFYTRITAVDDVKPDQWLTRTGARPLDESGSPLHYTLAPDLKGYEITAVELVIDQIDIETRLGTNGAAETSFFQKHHVNFYGHAKPQTPQAVPTPTAAAAGVGLLGLTLSRRRRRLAD